MIDDKVSYIYIDESFLKIDGKLHMLIGAYALQNPLQVSLEFENKLEELNIEPDQEIKWHMKGIDEQERHAISRLVLEISNSYFNKFFLSMAETTAHYLKEEPFNFFLEQLSDWSKAENVKGVYLMIDEGLLPQVEVVEPQIKASLSLSGTKLLGIQFIKSRYDRALQITDIRLGMMNWIINAALKNKTVIVEYDFTGGGNMIDMNLTDLILLSARDSYWGKYIIKASIPFTQIAGHGLRIKSSLPKNTRKTIMQSLDRVYIGCFH